jgi:hypothetical protein
LVTHFFGGGALFHLERLLSQWDCFAMGYQRVNGLTLGEYSTARGRLQKSKEKNVRKQDFFD